MLPESEYVSACRSGGELFKFLSIYHPYVFRLLVTDNDRWLGSLPDGVPPSTAALKLINSLFEFVIRENMDFTNEIPYS